MSRPVITLLTDFGCADSFVGSMKGVLVSIAPEAAIIDITHEVPPHNVLAGAYLLRAASPCFPPGTVHVAVVDPGVGTRRRAIVAKTKSGLFVGPDNGLLSLAAAQAGVQAVFWARRSKLFLPSVSATFHGRDVFAPLGARLAMGLSPEKCGPSIANHVKLNDPPRRRVSGTLQGVVVWLDHFGNLITNIRESDLHKLAAYQQEERSCRHCPAPAFLARRLSVTIEGATIHGLSLTYGIGRPGQLVALINSAGLLEIAARQRSAAEETGAGPGAHVIVKVGRS